MPRLLAFSDWLKQTPKNVEAMQPAQPTPMSPPPAYSEPAAPGRRRVVIARMDVMSLAKIYGLSMAVMGFIFGLFFGLLMAGAGSAASEAGAAEAGILAGVGMFAIIVFPLMYGFLGFIAGIVGALVYNVLAKWVGGIAVEVE